MRVLRVILLGFMAVLCAFAIVNSNGWEVIMYSGKKIKTMTYRKPDVILNVLEPRLYRSCSSYAGMQNKLAAYISAGYTLVNGPASGEIDMSTYDIGKYLIVWYSEPTGAIEITANTILAHTASGNGTGAQESVVIFGALLSGASDVRITGYYIRGELPKSTLVRRLRLNLSRPVLGDADSASSGIRQLYYHGSSRERLRTRIQRLRHRELQARPGHKLQHRRAISRVHDRRAFQKQPHPEIDDNRKYDVYPQGTLRVLDNARKLLIRTLFRFVRNRRL